MRHEYIKTKDVIYSSKARVSYAYDFNNRRHFTEPFECIRKENIGQINLRKGQKNKNFKCDTRISCNVENKVDPKDDLGVVT